MLPFSAQITRQITWFCLGFSNVVIGRKLPYLDSIEVHSSSILTFMAPEPHIFFGCVETQLEMHTPFL